LSPAISGASILLQIRLPGGSAVESKQRLHTQLDASKGPLFDEMQIARRRYDMGECTREEYVSALAHFTDLAKARRSEHKLHPSRKTKSIHEIEQFLFSELARMRDAHDDARKHFSAVATDIPSGIPQRDGNLRIKNAARDNTAALEAYMRALREFNDFVIHRKIPERFR
jgi:hypothetical protein